MQIIINIIITMAKAGKRSSSKGSKLVAKKYKASKSGACKRKSRHPCYVKYGGCRKKVAGKKCVRSRKQRAKKLARK